MNAIESTEPHSFSWADSAGRFVHKQISSLQSEISNWRPARSDQIAALAQLRRGVGKELGELPELLEFVVDPDGSQPWGDEPTPLERATYVAVTLYALHQQSKAEPMHVPDMTFASAVGGLRFRHGVEVPGIMRRFQAMATSAELNELVYHSRGLITLLKQEGRGFDYGRFARDLVRYQNAFTVKYVRLSWGRDFYRVQVKAKG